MPFFKLANPVNYWYSLYITYVECARPKSTIEFWIWMPSIHTLPHFWTYPWNNLPFLPCIYLPWLLNDTIVLHAYLGSICDVWGKNSGKHLGKSFTPSKPRNWIFSLSTQCNWSKFCQNFCLPQNSITFDVTNTLFVTITYCPIC